MKKYKMIATDLDQTLLNKDKRISKRNLNAIRRAVKENFVVVLASGRVMKSIESYRNFIDIEAPIISCNGAYAKDHMGNIVIAKNISYDIIKQIAKIGDKYDVYYHFYNHENIYSKFAGDKFNKYYFTSGYDNERVNIKIPYDDIAQLESQGIKLYKALFISLDIALRDRVEAELREILGTTVTSSIRNNIEVTAENVDKGSALDEIAKIYNIKRDEIIAIGDNRNDMPMVDYAGFGIAVENSAKSLKDISDLVVCSNEEDAVAKVIEKYLLGENIDEFEYSISRA